MSRELFAAKGREVDVERVFGRDGIWAELLAQGDRFLGSELVLKSRAERRYLAFDFWHSHRDYERFCGSHRGDLERFAELLATEGILEREVFLGAFYEPEGDEGTDIVPV